LTQVGPDTSTPLAGVGVPPNRTVVVTFAIVND